MPGIEETTDYYKTRQGQLQNTPLISAAVSRDANEVDRILREYPNHSDYINLHDLWTDDGYHNTALILAAMGNDTRIAMKLIECGADVTLANNHGTTALHYACIKRNHELIAALISNGARWDQTNIKGITPLDLYLYEFYDFVQHTSSIREVDLMREHLDNRPISDNREKLRVNILEEQILKKQEAIPRLVKALIPPIINKVSPLYLYNVNDPAEFISSLVAFAYHDYEEFRKAWEDLAKDYPNPEKRKQPMKDAIIKILSDKYGEPQSYPLEYNISQPSPTIETPVSGAKKSPHIEVTPAEDTFAKTNESFDVNKDGLTTEPDFAQQFFREHAHKLHYDRNRFLGYFRTLTNIDKNWDLGSILEHAYKNNNRSREVCIKLGWLNSEGLLNEKMAPQVVKDAYTEMKDRLTPDEDMSPS